MHGDEGTNYEDFMMSDEEDVEMSDMGFESDDDESMPKPEEKKNESKPIATPEDRQQEVNNELERLYQHGNSHLDNQNFEAARGAFMEIYSIASKLDDNAFLIWALRSLNELMLSCSVELRYNGISPALRSNILSSCTLISDFLIKKSTQIDETLLLKMLWESMTELFPSINVEILFESPKEKNNRPLIDRMQLQLDAIALFKNVIMIPKEIKSLLQTKNLVAKLWFNYFTTMKVDLSTSNFLENGVYNAFELDATKNAHISYTVLESLSTLLEVNCMEFLRTGEIEEHTQFQKHVNQLYSLTSASIFLSQKSDLMVLLNFSKAILCLLNGDRQNDNIVVTKFFTRIRESKDCFLKALKSFEEMGNNEKKFASLFHQIIIAGFIITSIILLKGHDNDKIDPFDFEQVRILACSPTVQKLHSIAEDFASLNLRKLYTSVQRVPEIAHTLHILISNLYRVAQWIILWERIAPVYSCISISDVREKLRIADSIDMTRDDLLTILMMSIMKGKAIVFFKLDLINDLIYFGEDYKVQLTTHPKENFRSQEVDTQNKDGPCEDEYSSAKLSDLEYANNVGMYVVPQKPKQNTIDSFFDGLKKARENVDNVPRDEDVGMVFNEFQPSNVAFSNKYNDLVELVASRLRSSAT